MPKYHTALFKVTQHPLQSNTTPSSKYHTTLFRVTYHPLQSTTPPFKVPHCHPSKNHTTLFKVTYHPLQSTTSTTPPSSKYHTAIFKAPHHPLQCTTYQHRDVQMLTKSQTERQSLEMSHHLQMTRKLSWWNLS